VNCLRTAQYDVHEKKERKMKAPIKKRKMKAPIKMERNDSAEKNGRRKTALQCGTILVIMYVLSARGLFCAAAAI
jgi:hypothetical protein